MLRWVSRKSRFVSIPGKRRKTPPPPNDPQTGGIFMDGFSCADGCEVSLFPFEQQVTGNMW